MSPKNNISNIVNCYGCGVCAIICPQQIISIRQNADGFYAPFISDAIKCIHCGLCIKTCSFTSDSLANESLMVGAYAGWSENINVRLRCSSGGIGFAIAEDCINKGYKACGVRYNCTDRIAEHFIADNVQDYISSIGSKYIQSYTYPGFSQLDTKTKFFVSGTPCQIDSIRRYIQLKKIEDNFVLVDFFCHGVPSMLLWKKYSQEIESQIGEIRDVSWRNKCMGWHDSWVINVNPIISNESLNWHDSYALKIREKKSNYFSPMSQGDLFYEFFLNHYCLGKQCHKYCKFKMDHSSADIRIGDMWGRKYTDNYEGVSAVITLTEKGDKILKSITSIHIEQTDKDVVMEGQMSKCPPQPIYRSVAIQLLKSTWSLKSIAIILLWINRLVNIHHIIYQHIKRIMPCK